MRHFQLSLMNGPIVTADLLLELAYNVHLVIFQTIFLIIRASFIYPPISHPHNIYQKSLIPTPTPLLSHSSGNYSHRLGRPYTAGRPCSLCRRSCNSKKRLCTNSCPWRDRWSNCQELERRDRSWTCGRGEPGKSCRATCRCSGRIH